MAEDKKSFVLYCDLIHTFEKLTDVEAGQLIKHLLAYVNDRSPKSERIIEVMFEPIKQQLKRDLIKYESKRKQWSEAGKASAIKRKQSSTDVESRSTDSTVSVNVNDSVNVSVSAKKKNKIYIPPSESELIAYVVGKGFSESLGKKVFEYYSTADWHDANGKKVKNWKQKLLSVWLKDENKPQKNKPQQLTPEEMDRNTNALLKDWGM